MNPKISIIIPIYNVDKYLEKCLDSILNQTFKDFEVILVNDGSTDNSDIIIDRYSKLDNRLKAIHQKNGGVSHARNVGVKASKGEYIGFVDPDDWIYEDMFMNLYEVAISTNSDIVVCRHYRQVDGQIINKDEESEYIKEMNNKDGMKELFKGQLYRFALWNKLFIRHLFDEIEFPEGRIHEDLSTTYKLFSKARKITYTNYSGYVYVKRENSILTTKFNKERLQSFIAWEEILEFMKKYYNDIYYIVISCYTYWSIDNMYYVLQQISNSKKEYLYIIQKSLRKNYKDILRNRTLSIKYKLLTLMICLDIRLILLMHNLK